MKHDHTILALDPGLRDLGYAVLKGKHLLDAGTKTFRFTPPRDRHRVALAAVRDWIERHSPTVVVLEATPGNSHPTFRALRKLGLAIARLARAAGLPYVAYPAQTVRKALLGNGWASKRDMAIALAARYPTLRVYVNQTRRWKERYFQNMFDALALALYHSCDQRRSTDAKRMSDRTRSWRMR
jgi:Holliday junction resolvasome RuvABC endonuclease subunit